MQTLPAGLIDTNIEFFACPDLNAYCINSGKVISHAEFDEPLLKLVEADINKYPVKVQCLNEMALAGRLERIKTYLICNYGGFDNQPDIKDGELQHTEYWPCPKRGTCPYEGRLCDSLRTDTGAHLTHREIEVLTLTASGLLNKEIAAQLDISIATVAEHTKHLRQKTGLQRKPELTRFAIQKNLL